MATLKHHQNHSQILANQVMTIVILNFEYINFITKNYFDLINLTNEIIPINAVSDSIVADAKSKIAIK